jgi:pyrimidine-nucleoside phosphorylase
MNVQTVLAHRRDGVPHTREEIQFLVGGACDGTIADYQLSAWLMAACIHPLGREETAWLTQAMADSGERLDLSGLPKPWVDKHSTGGVGDKTSLVLLPLLASCGLTVVKMSGRGLGITGGTVDKLSSVPGFRMDLTPEEALAQAARIGVAITGQTPKLAPADKILYALRDATATVESLPLIVSSILSKKLAGGAEIVVLDVKCGSGAFMKTLEDARALASSLRDTAAACGLKVRTAVTDMSCPLGRAVGNALEVREALAVLAGDPPSARFRELCVELAGLTLAASGMVDDETAGRAHAEGALASGAAMAKAREWFEAQGAAADATVHPERLPVAPVRLSYGAPSEAFVAGIDAGQVGEAVVALGGGRLRKENEIDPSVGVEFHCEIGDRLSAGQSAFAVHAASGESAAAAVEAVAAAFTWSAVPVAARPVALGE